MPRGALPGEHRGGRPKGALSRYTAHAAVRETLARIKCDPFEIMGRLAIRDVVGLGMMTQEELDAPAVYGVLKGRRVLLQPSGIMRANALINAELRHRASADLGRYLAPQLATIAHTDAEGKSIAQPRTVVVLPDNGR